MARNKLRQTMNGEIHSPMPAPKARLVWIVLAAGFGVLVVLLLALLIWRNGVTQKVNRRLKAAWAAGYPISAKDLHQWYATVAEEENAARIYAEAIAALAAAKSGDEGTMPLYKIKLPNRAAAPDAALQRQLASMLEERQAVLQALLRAAALEKCRYPADLSKGLDVELPHLAKLTECAQLLELATVHALGRGQTNEAVAAVHAAFALGRSLQAEPVVISQLVRYSTDALALRALERVINQAALSEIHLNLLLADLARADTPQGMVRALAGERAGCIQYFRLDATPIMSNSPGEHNRPTFVDKFCAKLGRASGFFERDLAFYLEMMGATMAAVELPPPKNVEAARKFESRLLEGQKQFYILSSLLLPALGKCVLREAEHSARLRTAQVALAIERYRRTHQNRLPAALADLAPALLPEAPTDPFDGQPLRYQIRDRGYVVYSVGNDGQDDGGTERKPVKEGGKPSDPADLPFTVER
jgi:type II secretory pathway pseudopilin PulG